MRRRWRSGWWITCGTDGVVQHRAIAQIKNAPAETGAFSFAALRSGVSPSRSCCESSRTGTTAPPRTPPR
ncbi:hypothetical protein [Lysobacter gummosus]|uniref:hypothetical protein n=1 Tax=Lysobacter gummosus TaxID=262324 RepID=UPI003630F8F2